MNVAVNTQNIIVSDYESDAPAYPNDLPPALPPITRTREELNVAVLQKHNPEIISILSVAPYVTIYEFAADPEPGWQKSGVVGTLFICQLTPGTYNEERYHVIVLNRNGLDNFEAQLRQSEKGGVDILDEYVIITSEEQGAAKVNGIYIYSEGEGTSTAAAREANGPLMKQLALAAQRSQEAAKAQAEAQRLQAAQPQQSPAQPSSTSQDLLSLLQGGLRTGPTHAQQQAQPQPVRYPQNDLLSLLRGSQSTPPLHTLPQQSNIQSHPPTGVGHGMPPSQNVLGDLFKRAGLASL